MTPLPAPRQANLPNPGRQVMAYERLAYVRLIAVDRAEALELLARLHSAQNSFYSGGAEGELCTLLAPDIVWHVPGRNLIAGTYRGHDDVIGYFTHRLGLAGNTFRIARRDVLTGEGNTFAVLADGEATLAGMAQRWSTVGCTGSWPAG